MNWLTKIGIVLGGLLVVYAAHTFLVSQAVKAENTRVVAIYDKAFREQEVLALKTTADLQAAARKKEKELYERSADIITALNNDLDGLRKRPTRSELNTAVARAERSCTGSELYREDAAFLTREASRAEQLILERDYYYAEYERARRALAALQGQDAGLNEQNEDRKSHP